MKRRADNPPWMELVRGKSKRSEQWGEKFNPTVSNLRTERSPHTPPGLLAMLREVLLGGLPKSE